MSNSSNLINFKTVPTYLGNVPGEILKILKNCTYISMYLLPPLTYFKTAFNYEILFVEKSIGKVLIMKNENDRYGVD